LFVIENVTFMITISLCTVLYCVTLVSHFTLCPLQQCCYSFYHDVLLEFGDSPKTIDISFAPAVSSAELVTNGQLIRLRRWLIIHIVQGEMTLYPVKEDN